MALRIALLIYPYNGVHFGAIEIVDSVHSAANVNTDKDEQRRKKGKPPRDGDGRWGVKHQRKVCNAAGKVEQQTQYFYGHKAHMSLNAESGLITAVEVTSGEAYDGHHLVGLVVRPASLRSEQLVTLVRLGDRLGLLACSEFTICDGLLKYFQRTT